MLKQFAHQYQTFRLFSAHPVEIHKKVTLSTISKLYSSNIPITMMTAHDYPTGVFAHESELDICLVGDSLAMVFDSSHLGGVGL